MRRIARSLVLLVPPLSLAAATAVPADATYDVRAMLSLHTEAAFGGASVTVTAHGEFVGGLIDNSTVALQVGGVEAYVDAYGIPRSMPFACHGEAIRFTATNTVSCTAALQSSDSVVSFAWTAEAAGAAPTVFFGSCAGTGVRTSGTELIIPVC